MPRRRDTNGIGDVGENAVRTRLQSMRSRRTPLFKLVHLGEKYPLADFYVEVNNSARTRAFFFIQVKSTTTNHPHFSVDGKKLTKLLGYGAPTFVALVDKMDQLLPRVFLCSVHERPVRSRYPKVNKLLLTETKLEMLKSEVIQFWRGRVGNNKPMHSAF